MPASRRRRFFYISAVLVILLAATYGVVHNFNSPAVGTVQRLNGPPPETPLDITKQKTARGKYLSFGYPAAFTLINHSGSNGGSLESFSFKKSPEPFWTLNVNVLTYSGNLDDYSSVHIREQDPGCYQKEVISVGTQTATIFTDITAPYTKVAFLTKGSELASVALISTDNQDQDSLNQILNLTLKSVVWH